MLLLVSVVEPALSHDHEPSECSSSDLLPGVHACLVRACESKSVLALMGPIVAYLGFI